MPLLHIGSQAALNLRPLLFILPWAVTYAHSAWPCILLILASAWLLMCFVTADFFSGHMMNLVIITRSALLFSLGICGTVSPDCRGTICLQEAISAHCLLYCQWAATQEICLLFSPIRYLQTLIRFPLQLLVPAISVFPHMRHTPVPWPFSWPVLDLLLYVHLCCIPGSPELDTVLQVQPY